MTTRRDSRIVRPAQVGPEPADTRSEPWLHHAYVLPVVRELPQRHPDDGVEETW